jgi:hypothetical protein
MKDKPVLTRKMLAEIINWMCETYGTEAWFDRMRRKEIEGEMERRWPGFLASLTLEEYLIPGVAKKNRALERWEKNRKKKPPRPERGERTR